MMLQLIYTVLIAIGAAVPGFLFGALGRIKPLLRIALALILVIVAGWMLASGSSPEEWAWANPKEALGLIAISLAFVSLPALVVGAMAGVLAAMVFGFGVGDPNRATGK